MELQREIQELTKKAQKFEYRQEMDGKIIEKVKSAIEILKDVLVNLDPAISLGKTRTNTGVKYTQIARELYKLLQAGTEISTDFIEKTYPNIEESWQRSAIMQRLKNMPNVETRKNGIQLILFARRG